MKTHLPHPKCTGCGRSLFKSATKGAIVKPSMPYVFCHNKSCSYGKFDSLKHSLQKIEGVANGVQKAIVVPRRSGREGRPAPKAVKLSGKKPYISITDDPLKESLKPIRKAIPAAERKSKPADSEVVAVARVRVAQLIKAFGNEIGLVLALANQETGHNEAANLLIDEYRLTELFGLEKF